MYRVQFERGVTKAVTRLPSQLRRRIESAFIVLAHDPRPRAATKLRSQDLYRVRVGDYRIVYRIEDDVLLVLVVAVAHRREVYRDLD